MKKLFDIQLFAKWFNQRKPKKKDQFIAPQRKDPFRVPQENKYHNRVIEWNGEKFHSEAELARFRELMWLERHGDITQVERQTKFELIPAMKDDHGNVIERAVNYIADFVYFNKKDEMVVEDVKGVATKEYIIKRKLMLFRYGIRIKEIKAY